MELIFKININIQKEKKMTKVKIFESFIHSSLERDINSTLEGYYIISSSICTAITNNRVLYTAIVVYEVD